MFVVLACVLGVVTTGWKDVDGVIVVFGVEALGESSVYVEVAELVAAGVSVDVAGKLAVADSPCDVGIADVIVAVSVLVVIVC